ncbi:integral membrane protein duf6, putative [Heliomicrobium modesticaldum Ice1]|uniref:Integral membrane protein duf6, putative n=1 Tax=Heliobacterium modesticaldum (strain ATCC 51547 / Ice1) TaxID=498761 RepID=B0TDB0_HELMI|nr:DMT family transporter [Heliomicrobium modesticaldum]ABZ84151.1 integral membrane protein duf6, putative [Heliomicrobium modesticaldum Ice1]
MNPFYKLILTPLIWATNFVMGRLLVVAIPPFALSSIRFAIAALIMLPLALRTHPFWQISRRSWGWIGLMAVTGVCLFNTVLYLGLRYTASVNATLINSLSPMVTAMLVFLIDREKIQPSQAAGILLSVAGITVVAAQGSWERLAQLSFNPGDLLVLLATALWALYTIAGRKAAREVPVLAATGYSFAIGALLLLPMGLLDWNLSAAARQPAAPWMWGAAVYLGIFASVIAFYWWNQAVQAYGATVSSLFQNLITVYAAGIAYWGLQEPLFGYHWLGGALVFGGALLASGISQRKKPAQETVSS